MKQHFLTIITFLSGSIIFFASSVAVAMPIEHGVFRQGGFIVGQVAPGALVHLQGEKVRTGPEGRFFAGLHRHFPPQGVLEVIPPGGQAQTHTFAVAAQTYKNQHIKGVQKKHITPDPAQVKRSQKEAQQIKAARTGFSPTFAALAGGFKTPVEGAPITGVYGSKRTYNGQERSWHKGLDLAAPTGTPVYAPADGIVRAALDETFFNGNTIIIDHGYGLFSLYAHLNDMLVTPGEEIDQGMLIGKVGSTGRSTGPHLHLGFYWHHTPLDPLAFLPHTDTE